MLSKSVQEGGGGQKYPKKLTKLFIDAPLMYGLAIYFFKDIIANICKGMLRNSKKKRIQILFSISLLQVKISTKVKLADRSIDVILFMNTLDIIRHIIYSMRIYTPVRMGIEGTREVIQEGQISRHRKYESILNFVPALTFQTNSCK